jgi:glycosyltransferase involved in cell wall biosynthesis
MHKISIVTPYQNTAKYIVQTAESIFAQTHSNWEWILINDHSSQNEEELLKTFLKDNRVKLITNEGAGIVDALNSGMSLVSGDFVTRMDADDIMPANKLELLLTTLLDSNADIATGKVQYFSEDASISEGYQKYENWLNERVELLDFDAHIYRECSVASANWLIKTDTLNQCGAFKGLEYPEDYDLMFRFYEHNLKITATTKLTHLWRDHSERTSKNSEDYNQRHFFNLKVKRFVELESIKIPIVLNGTGQKGRLVAKVLLDNKVAFDWVSHEAHKYLQGIFEHPIQSVSDINYGSEILVLNTTLIEAKVLIELYGKNTLIAKIITF